MRQKPERHQDAAERTIKDIRRQTRKRYSSEEKIRIVLAGLRGEDSIAELCRREGLNANIEMRTVNGSITSEDFPITVQGRIDRRRLEGKIGKGGPELSVSTVNGSIRLRKN